MTRIWEELTAGTNIGGRLVAALGGRITRLDGGETIVSAAEIAIILQGSYPVLQT